MNEPGRGLERLYQAGRRRPVLFAGAWLCCALVTGYGLARATKTERVDCHEYAERAAERRGLTHGERKMVERSCSTSKIYSQIEKRKDAETFKEKLRTTKHACAKPGPYVAHDPKNENQWAVFCPML